MKLRSLYHTPKGEKGIGKWVVGWTWLLALLYDRKALRYNYSHEEIWIPDENGKFSYTADRVFRVCLPRVIYLGQCFSSTTRGDSNGVRFAPASKVLHNPDRWEYIQLEVNDQLWADALELMEGEVGKEYDFPGITGFVLPLGQQRENRWYCSEICNWIKEKLGIGLLASHPISPRRSAFELAKIYGEPVKL